MSSRLANLAAPVGANTAKTRAGRGVGSGLGKTAGRGQKGQKARSTGQMGRLWFQGGETPLARRLPKRGFRSRFPESHELRLSTLDQLDANSVINLETLKAQGLVPKSAVAVKILATGEVTKAFEVKVPISKGAAAKIVAAGGKVAE